MGRRRKSERARESRRSSPEQTATQQKHEMASMMSSVARKTVAPRRANSRKVALSAVRNGSRVCMMQVLKKELRYECLSYLPPLTDKEDLACGPGYYANRYYTMWKLPLFGCTDSSDVLKEVDECKKEYPDAVIRVVGFDRISQTQLAGFVVKH